MRADSGILVGDDDAKTVSLAAIIVTLVGGALGVLAGVVAPGASSSHWVCQQSSACSSASTPRSGPPVSTPSRRCGRSDLARG